MKFRTEITVDRMPCLIGHKNHLMMLGSCFTSSVGEYFRRYLFDVNVNPFGTIYNPMSVARNIRVLLDKEEYTGDDLFRYNDTWLSFDHYTAFSHKNREKLLLQINDSFGPAKKIMQETDRLLITFGTAWVFRLKESGQIVCNCHKVPASRFERVLLDREIILSEYKDLINRLTDLNPGIKIIFTVSPVRHWKDGAHGNQLSKAILLLAIDELLASFPEHCFYFPAYELLMDDLRDYRFYARDLLHPSEEAVDYIWEKFSSATLSEDSLLFIRQLDPLLKTLYHRPSDPDDPVYIRLMENTSIKISQLRKAYPDAYWEKLKAF